MQYPMKTLTNDFSSLSLCSASPIQETTFGPSEDELEANVVVDSLSFERDLEVRLGGCVKLFESGARVLNVHEEIRYGLMRSGVRVAANDAVWTWLCQHAAWM